MLLRVPSRDSEKLKLKNDETCMHFSEESAGAIHNFVLKHNLRYGMHNLVKHFAQKRTVAVRKTFLRHLIGHVRRLLLPNGIALDTHNMS